MKTYLRVAIFLLSCLLLTGCGGETWTWYQKLTVVVDTPDGEVSGSSVVSVMWGEEDSFTFTHPNALHGEATVVNLGDGRYLFALIGDSSKYLARKTFRGGPGSIVKSWAEMSKFKGKADVKDKLPVRDAVKSDLPILVTFGDINDPSSIKIVDVDDPDTALGCEKNGEQKLWLDLGMTYKEWQVAIAKESDEYKAVVSKQNRGVIRRKIIERLYLPRDKSNDCYKIKSITLEITDGPVTRGEVEKVLGWFNGFKGRIKKYSGPSRNVADVPAAELLTIWNFVRGTK